ncbi:MAG: xanthine phosphoribosyltransferase [Oscillospiraceae bacterium]|nr:xanthine phosphoribosyltransferase [Oscillospiraceae bacterium]
MEALYHRIRQEGKILPGSIVKVDSFLNHQVDARFLGELAQEFARRFDVSRATKILTAEASGIPLASVCSYCYGIPMVFAKKAKSDNIEGGLYCSDIFSYTYKKKVTLICSQNWITPKDKVLIIDDFMANGEAMRGLLNIVKQAGAELIGVGVAIEKGFQQGGDKLRSEGYPLQSLAIIDRADENGFVFRGE